MDVGDIMTDCRTASFEDVLEARSDVTSQKGENGLVAFLCDIIGCREQTCVEFGAWDGVHLSNLYPFWHDRGWRALLIEGDKARFAELSRNTIGFAVTAVNAHVTEKGPNHLLELATRNSFPVKWDILSIDIDGNDLAVLESINLIQSAVGVVIVEFNNSIPPHVEYESRGRNYTGSSALSFVTMMRRKKYELVCICGTNLVFTSKSNFDRHFGYDNSLPTIFDYSNISYLMSDYAGNLICDRFPDHTLAGHGPLGFARRMARKIKHPMTRRDPRNGAALIRTIQVLDRGGVTF